MRTKSQYKKMTMTVIFLCCFIIPRVYAQEAFKCFGVYSDVQTGEDESGLQITIKSESAISAKVFEGSSSTTKAKDVKITGSKVVFRFWDNIFEGICDKSKIKYRRIGTNPDGTICSGCKPSFSTLKLVKKLSNPFEVSNGRKIGNISPLNDNTNLVDGDLPLSIQKDDDTEQLKEARERGFSNINDYQDYLDKQRRLNESGIVLRQKR